jgi:hypothetical protein
MSLSHEKMKKLQKGKTCQLKHEEIQAIASSVRLSNANKRKLERAFRNHKGIRIQLSPDEIEENYGSGLMSSIKKGAAQGANFVKNNKQLNNLKNQAIDKGLNYAVNKAGLSDEVGDVVKGLSKSAINHGFNQVANGAGFMNVAKKGMKIAKQGVKVANKVSNALGYDDVDNMIIDNVVGQTVGRIDPTLGNITAKALNRAADKHLGGSFRKMGEGVNPYLPHTYGSGFTPSRPNQPQKMTGQDVGPNLELRNQILKNVPIQDELFFI